MKNLQLDNKTALEIYPTAAPALKTIMEQSFGKDFFSQKITDRLKSLVDCFDFLGLDRSKCIPYPSPVNSRQVAVNGVEEVFIAMEAINEGWIPDFDNSNEVKYEIYWDMRNGGLVFDDVVDWDQVSRVGSRLCFKSADLAKWAAKQEWFIEICKKFMVRKSN